MIKMKLQLFAEEADASNSGTGTEAQTTATETAGETKTVNMAEAERIATDRASRAEQAAMKSYLQQQGMTEDEIKEAITSHKSAKTAKAEADKGNLTAVQKRAEEAEAKLTIAEKSANARIISAEAKGVARDLGVSKESIPYVLKLADLSMVTVDANGDPDAKALEAAINKALLMFLRLMALRPLLASKQELTERAKQQPPKNACKKHSASKENGVMTRGY